MPFSFSLLFLILHYMATLSFCLHCWFLFSSYVLIGNYLCSSILQFLCTFFPCWKSIIAQFQTVFLFCLCILGAYNVVQRTCIYTVPFHGSVSLHKLLFFLGSPAISERWEEHRIKAFASFFVRREWLAKETNPVKREVNDALIY